MIKKCTKCGVVLTTETGHKFINDEPHCDNCFYDIFGYWLEENPVGVTIHRNPKSGKKITFKTEEEYDEVCDILNHMLGFMGTHFEETAVAYTEYLKYYFRPYKELGDNYEQDKG